ncbi:lytic murein transglycosylase [Moritella viscosa]
MLGKKVLFLLGLAAFQANSAELSSEHKTWVEELSTKYDISKQVLTDAVLTKIQTPWEKKPWYKYAPIFITESRINKGVEYWKQYEETFAKAEAEYGVPAQVIVAIMGVETFYGKYKGNISVLDSLYTLGFNYPSRGKFFRQEFAQYIKLSEQQGWNLTDTQGSYAGAMGLGQFISSSYSHYGVDFSGDGKVDMINDPIDAIGSIANYFNKHNWKADESVAYPVKVRGQI